MGSVLGVAEGEGGCGKGGRGPNWCAGDGAGVGEGVGNGVGLRDSG